MLLPPLRTRPAAKVVVGVGVCDLGCSIVLAFPIWARSYWAILCKQWHEVVVDRLWSIYASTGQAATLFILAEQLVELK